MEKRLFAFALLSMVFLSGCLQSSGQQANPVSATIAATPAPTATPATTPAPTATPSVAAASPTAAPAATKAFSIDADDNGYYLSNGQDIAAVDAAKGDAVKITFKVRTKEVYHSGLDFKGCGQAAGAKPGETATLQFAAQGTCTITSYWPTTQVQKATLQVVVR